FAGRKRKSNARRNFPRASWRSFSRRASGIQTPRPGNTSAASRGRTRDNFARRRINDISLRIYSGRRNESDARRKNARRISQHTAKKKNNLGKISGPLLDRI